MSFTPEEYFKYLCKDPVAVQHYTDLQHKLDIAEDIEVMITMLHHELKESKKLLKEIKQTVDDGSMIDMMIEGSGIELDV